MAEKTLKTRIIQKHDIEANWLLATNFTPMNGEIIIYDEDDNHDYKRIKIGNGTDNVNDLDFVVNKEDIPAQVQADWLVNDESNPAYVKNRPFYVGEPVETYLFNGTYNIMMPIDDTVFISILSQSFNYSFTVGQQVTVDFNGTKYELVGQEYSDEYMPITAVFGNMAFKADVEDTGEPFLFFAAEGMLAMYYTGEESGTMKISIMDTPIFVDKNSVPALQGDWNENDSSSANYIKNRPFYTHFVNVEFANGDLQFEAVPVDDATTYYGATIANDVSINECVNVKLTLDGIEYNPMPGIFGTYGNTYFLGKLEGLSDEEMAEYGIVDNGEPYMILPGELLINLSGETHNVVLTADTKEIVKISERYLPDDLARTSDIKEYNVVTTSANGLMIASDKVKLNSVESGSQVNIIESIQVNDKNITVTDKMADIQIGWDTIGEKNVIDVLFESSATFSDKGFITNTNLNTTSKLIDGETYIVRHNGIDYTLRAFTVDNAVIVGNANFIDSKYTNTDEPFALKSTNESSKIYAYFYSWNEGIKISHCKNIITTINENYLPPIKWENVQDKPFEMITTTSDTWTFDGDLTKDNVYQFEGVYFIHVSDTITLEDLKKGGSIYDDDAGLEKTFTEVDIVENSENGTYTICSFLAMFTPEEIEGMPKGFYVLWSDEVIILHPTKVKVNNYQFTSTIETIKPSALPKHLQFGSEVLEEEIIFENRTLTFDEYGQCTEVPSFTLEKDTNYTVVWDGIEYVCTSIYEPNFMGTELYALGDFEYIFGSSTTDEPFVIAYAKDSLKELLAKEGTSHVVTLKKNAGEKIEYIDNKYIKDMYGEKVVDVVDIPSQKLTFSEVTSKNSYKITNPFVYQINTSSSYIVIWDGVQYTGLPVEFNNQICIGRGELSDVNCASFPNGEPFAILLNYNGDLIVYSETSGEHTIEVLHKETQVTKVPEKYLPSISSSYDIVYFIENGKLVTNSTYEEVKEAIDKGSRITLTTDMLHGNDTGMGMAIIHYDNCTWLTQDETVYRLKFTDNTFSERSGVTYLNIEQWVITVDPNNGVTNEMNMKEIKVG